MLAAQEAAYGDALSKDERHPYMGRQGDYYSPQLVLQLPLSLRATLRAGSICDLPEGASRISGSL